MFNLLLQDLPDSSECIHARCSWSRLNANPAEWGSRSSHLVNLPCKGLQSLSRIPQLSTLSTAMISITTSKWTVARSGSAHDNWRSRSLVDGPLRDARWWCHSAIMMQHRGAQRQMTLHRKVRSETNSEESQKPQVALATFQSRVCGASDINCLHGEGPRSAAFDDQLAAHEHFCIRLPRCRVRTLTRTRRCRLSTCRLA